MAFHQIEAVFVSIVTSHHVVVSYISLIMCHSLSSLACHIISDDRLHLAFAQTVAVAIAAVAAVAVATRAVILRVSPSIHDPPVAQFDAVAWRI
jgi:hypothetical protein